MNWYWLSFVSLESGENQGCCIVPALSVDEAMAAASALEGTPREICDVAVFELFGKPKDEFCNRIMPSEEAERVSNLEREEFEG